MLSFLMLSTIVNAQPPETENTEVEDAPLVWFNCQPFSGLLDLEKSLPDSFRQGTWGIGDAGASKFKELGGVLDGQMIGYGSQEMAMEIPFNGTDEQIPEMLNILHPDAINWKGNDSTWHMEFADDHWMVRRSENGLRLQSISFLEEELPDHVSYIQSQPAREGCWLVVLSNETIGEKIPLNGSLFFPFADDPMSVLYTPEKGIPPMLQGSGGPTMNISTQIKPAVVGVLGFDWNELFLDPTIQEQIGLTEEEAKKIVRRLRLQPGGLIAFEDINIQKDPRIAIGLELHNRWGKPQCGWLIWRGIKQTMTKGGVDYLELDERLISFENNGQPIYIGVGKGRILVSNTRETVDQMMLNEGTPWVSDSLRQLAMEHPIAAQLAVPPSLGMMMGGLASVEIAMGSVDSRMQFLVKPRLSSGQSWTTLLPLFLGQLPLPPPSEEVKPNAVELQMRDLAVKEHQFHLQEGYYKPMGRTGLFLDPDVQVDLSIVDSAPVVESGVGIGWMEQSEEALYWIETDEKSFVVHALALIEGQFFHLTKDHLGVLEKTLLD